MTEDEDGALDGGGIFAETEERTGELEMPAQVLLFRTGRVSRVRDGVGSLGKHALRGERWQREGTKAGGVKFKMANRKSSGEK